MKAYLTLFRMAAIIATGLLLFAFSCEKDEDNNNDNDNDNGGWWNPDWLIGTWEGTTPSTITPFENTKIRIVFESYVLETHDTIPAGASKVYAYSGTLYWDVDGNAPWNMQFSSDNYPLPDYNIIIWNCMDAGGGYTMNNISLRITDAVQVDPWHSIDLDWGPFVDNTGDAPEYIDFYGDVEIDISGTLFRADYPPDEGSMIRLTKK
jgi:hypothetical protein